MKQPRGDGKYVAKDEVHNKKQRKKEARGMKKAGMAVALKASQKEMGKAKIPKVKPQKKV